MHGPILPSLRYTDLFRFLYQKGVGSEISWQREPGSSLLDANGSTCIIQRPTLQSATTVGTLGQFSKLHPRLVCTFISLVDDESPSSGLIGYDHDSVLDRSHGSYDTLQNEVCGLYSRWLYGDMLPTSYYTGDVGLLHESGITRRFATVVT